MRLHLLSLATFPALLGTCVAIALAQDGPSSPAGDDALPQRLSETGLYVAGSTREIAPGNLPFTPQYPLWSDGATKRRWLSIPAGTAIDASNPDAWEFPPGTRLWKEFSHGRPVETRLIERLADGSWRFAAYVWNEDGSDAVLAPELGLRAHPVASAPGGRYAIPSRGDCRACHEGAPVPVLGVSALQLSPDRDPLAVRAETPGADDVDLRRLVAMGWLKNLPSELLAAPPRIAAASPTERAALGYLHANCGHCHARSADSQSAVPVELILAQRVDNAALSVEDIRRSMFDVVPRYRAATDTHDTRVVVPGNAAASTLVQRMRSRNPMSQMPPLGTALVDAEGLALIEGWIDTRPTLPKD